ncbi:MAG: hypothetical protein JNK19_15365 [Tabrizicola sp.]|nr:hypothetical protein [Tabrizicola sp.]
MNDLASAVMHATPLPSSGEGFIERLRRRFARVEAAMAGQSRLAAIRPETESDTGLSAEELTGATSYDPALPFFLQSGFGRRDA